MAEAAESATTKSDQQASSVESSQPTTSPQTPGSPSSLTAAEAEEQSPAIADQPVNPAASPDDCTDKDRSKGDSATDATAESTSLDEKRDNSTRGTMERRKSSSTPVVSSSKKTRPPYKFDPSKITLRFLFANRDGLTVTIECLPSDTVADVKRSLLSVWPEGLPDCSGGDNLRLVCMGKGYLTPDTRTLEDCQIPTFKTHPTPVNVSIRPEQKSPDDLKKKGHVEVAIGSHRTSVGAANSNEVSQGCSCVIL